MPIRGPMSLVATVTVGLAVFAFGTAALNLWIYWMRPREPAHLWIGVASIGVVWISMGLAACYEARTAAQAQSALLLALGGALPFATGFVRFSELFAGIRHTMLRACIPYAAVVTTATYARPSLFFDGEAATIVPPLGEPYVRPELTLFASAVYAVFGLMIVTIVVGYARRARDMDGGFAITGALGFWGACMVNDMCVGLGLYWTPWLQPLGFVVFGGIFGWLLLRRLAHSQRQVERNAGELHALVDARTDELRRKDLELAHGARLATLGALAGGIAHEVKAPLAAIDAHVKELRNAWRDTTRPNAFAEHLADAQRSVERVRRVVAELLQLARREEGRSGVHDLPTIVAGVLPIAGYELRRRARIETHLASTPPVSGDAAMLSQIALNLLVGAIHAFPEAPQPGRRALIHLTTEDRGGCARLVVEDNAPALPGDVAIDLFELSDASGRERERRVQLAVTKQLVERHGGTIRIENGARGTRVTVDLRAAPEPGAPA